MRPTALVAALALGAAALTAGVALRRARAQTTPCPFPAGPSGVCKLHGKVKFVNSFPKYKIQIVDAFPDIKVKKVNAFPDQPGEWQIVDSFPDFTVQVVKAFPDFKVKYVDAFPGCP